MIDDNRTLNVLYFEDEPGNFDTRARNKYNLNVEYALNEKMGLDLLSQCVQKWDAIILDAKMPKAEGDIEEISTLNDTLRRIVAISGYHIYHYIYSAHGALLEPLYPRETWQDKAVYDKSVPESFDLLCQNIRRSFFKSQDEVAKIKLKYPLIHTISSLPCDSPSEESLINIVKRIETSESVDYNPNNDGGVFNEIRTILEWVSKYLYHLGLHNVEPTPTNIAACSTATCSNSQFVPVYIQRALHSLSAICNDGSHSLPTRELTNNGKAPFLVRSTVFEFLSVLSWLITFIDDDKSNAERRRAFEDKTKNKR